MNKILLLIAVVTVFTGCASMFNGPYQYVTVTPVNATAGDKPKCTLTNEEGIWEPLPNNTIVKVHRDDNDMTVDCSNKAQEGKIIVSPEFSEKYLVLDILLDLCIISCLVDGVNNSWYSYDYYVLVPMKPKTPIKLVK